MAHLTKRPDETPCTAAQGRIEQGKGFDPDGAGGAGEGSKLQVPQRGASGSTPPEATSTPAAGRALPRPCRMEECVHITPCLDSEGQEGIGPRDRTYMVKAVANLFGTAIFFRRT